MYRLPKNKKALARIVEQHATREEWNLRVRHTRYRLAAAYLAGARRFDVVDFRQQKVASFHLERDGRLPLQMQHLLAETNRMQGELYGANLLPEVGRDYKTLRLMREAAIGQVVLDALVDEHEHMEAKSTLIHQFTYLGCVGLMTDIEHSPSLGVHANFKTVHPQELMPFPSIDDDLSKQAGVMRQHMVPYEYLKKKLEDMYGVRISKQMFDEMEVVEREVGDVLEDQSNGVDSGDGGFSTPGGMSAEEAEKTVQRVVRLRELWMYGPRGTCSQYAVTSGRQTLLDERYADRGQKVFVPLNVARFLENGTFHGAGMFDLLFGGWREFEKMMSFLVRNVTDLQNQRVAILPAGTISESVFKDKGSPLRVLFVDQEGRIDPNRGIPPTILEPPNAGEVPGRTAAFLRDIMQGVSPVPDIIRDKGRVDSEVGLEFLLEEGGKVSNKSLQSLIRLHTASYRAALANGSRELALRPQALPVQSLTTDLAGVVLDEDSATVTLANNPLPRAEMLKIGVREGSSKRTSLAKQEAFGMFDRTQDIDALLLWAIDNGIELNWYYEDVKAAVMTVNENILRLYNDGVTRGMLVIAPYMERPEIQLRILNGFMTSPAMKKASPDVVEAFRDYQHTLMFFMGNVLPTPVQDPVEAALLARAQQGTVQGQTQNQLPQGALNG